MSASEGARARGSHAVFTHTHTHTHKHTQAHVEDVNGGDDCVCVFSSFVRVSSTPEVAARDGCFWRLHEAESSISDTATGCVTYVRVCTIQYMFGDGRVDVRVRDPPNSARRNAVPVSQHERFNKY